jgi:DNA-binding NarL/FixJ family response regulator
MEKYNYSSAELARLLQRCDFSDEEIRIISMRRRGYSVVQMMMELNLSERAIHRRMLSIKNKIERET